MSKKVILIILDGWGIPKQGEEWRSAIEAANVPYFRKLMSEYPNSTLEACGSAVGLPDGQMGNSEVGHMNLGAGRVVYQELERINIAVRKGELAKEPTLVEAFQYAKDNKKNVHFIGLVSDGGVHSHINHLKGLCRAADAFGLGDDTFVHAFTDGRDCDPKSGKRFLEDLQQTLYQTGVRLATISGRYYAMDRDKRWERVKMVYDAMVNGIPAIDETLDPKTLDNPKDARMYIDSDDVQEMIEYFYDEGITDEFLKPMVIVDEETNKPVATIKEGDVVMCFNFRTDRGREITEVLTQQDFPDFGMKALNLYYVTMTMYDESYKNVRVIYEKDNLNNTLGEVLERAEKKQIRIAETEKYPHVTFFFSGGHEQPFVGESRLMCPSPKDVATYDLKPQMAALDIDNAIIPELKKGEVDFVCLNFANPDMVGHTGVFSAVVSAVETVDKCLQQVVETALENGYTSIIIADHGNADYMLNDDKSPNTQHSLNLVPCIIVDKNERFEVKNGKLGDIAPTILTLMGVSIPKEMTGEVLI